MRLRRPGPFRGSSRLLARWLVLLLFAAIVPDLADAGCDPLIPATPGDVLTDASRADTGDDPCADGCVPDCFCCCQTLGASRNVGFEAPRLVMALAALARTRQHGVSPRVPEPVPRPTT